MSGKKLSDFSLDEQLNFFVLLDLQRTLRADKLNKLGLKTLDTLRLEVDEALSEKYGVRKRE